MFFYFKIKSLFFSLLQFLVYFVFIDFFQCIKEQQ